MHTHTTPTTDNNSSLNRAAQSAWLACPWREERYRGGVRRGRAKNGAAALSAQC
eukprot:m.67246 g.67246  ORF g.67246 m.67246 type:complete len:54 (-) comp9854_c0_seq1:1431-1592(-)